MALTAPVPPTVDTPDFFGAWGGLPVHVELSPLVLAVFLALVGVFVAAVTVILVYHWRRFPFEHETFRWVERLYMLGTVVFFGMAVLGILFSA